MFRLAWQAQPLAFIGVLSLKVTQGILPVGEAVITKLIFDKLAHAFQTDVTSSLPQELLFLLGVSIILGVLSNALGSAHTYLNAELGRKLRLQTQEQIYRKINSLYGLAPFENPQLQTMLQLASQGAHMGPSQSLGTLTSLLHNAITLVSFLGVLAAFNPLLAGLVALAALPQLFAQAKMGRQRFGLAEENSPKQRRTGYYGALFSAAYFVKELRLFDLGEFFLARFRQLTEELNHTQRAQQQRELRWQFGLDLVSKLVSSAAFVIVVVQAFQGRLTLGDVTLYTSAVGSVQGALSGIVFALANLHESALFFSRYTDLLALPQPIYIHPTPRPTPPLSSAIELRNVSFRYSPDHPWVLEDVSLTLPAGSCLALVGLNGAGKTTLVKLLTRLYDPTQGQILWDGVDIREFDPADLRRRMGAIFQDFVRFDLTAFENIALGDVNRLQQASGNGHAPAPLSRFGRGVGGGAQPPSPPGNTVSDETLAAVVQAAQKAGIHPTLQALPCGYHTTLSRWLADDGQGTDLSGGEWQKIALARLFMRNADLLILDEPTAALDAQAEYDVYSRFVELVNGRTSLLISHRFSTVRMADAVAVLQDGRIIEYGTHADLLALGGTYAHLYSLQAERYQ
jgi:ATP-binding cassette subfamily B protein